MNHRIEDTSATDYVLGELRGEKRAAFEKRLQYSDSLRAEVESIREALSVVKSELVNEASCVNASDLGRIEKAIRSTSDNLPAASANHSAKGWAVVMAVAACLLLMIGFAIPVTKMARSFTESGDAASRSDQMEIESFLYEEGASAGEDGSSDFGDSGGFGGGGFGGGGGMEAADAEKRWSRSSGPTSTLLRSKRLMSEQTETEAVVDAPATATVDSKAITEHATGRPGSQSARNFRELRDDASRRGLGEMDDDRESRLQFSSQEPRAVQTARRERMRLMQESPAPTRRGETDDLFSEAEISAESIEYDMFGVSPSNATPKVVAGDPLASGGSVTSQSGMASGRQDVSSLDFGVVGQGIEGRRSRPEESTKWRSHWDFRNAGQSGDQFARINDNPFKSVDADPLSTFSIDVDTASYAKVRMYLMQQNSLPRPDAVRIEEMINYFDYDYEPPTDERPFAATMDVATCPWNPDHQLARVGIKGKVIDDDRPSSNLVFLLDVSGSMNRPNKLPLVIDGMKMLADQLTENDSVAIVVYAGAAGMVLDSTTGDRRQVIHDALNRLKAGGSTNGGQGIQLAYALARDHFIVGGTNRVILCTDGDFNVGVTGTDQLVRIAEQNAKSNIFLSVLGFGSGNHNDAMMEQISNKGNGNYAFIDSKSEAQKVLVDQIGGTLVTIAKDVKIQVEFNPKEVSSYRLIGYENRVLAARDFNDDKKDAGEIGAGHTVTALYELVPTSAGSGDGAPAVDELRYQKRTKLSRDASSGELLTLKLRYKLPEESKSKLVSFSVKNEPRDFWSVDPDFQFAASVASFGMLLRQSPYRGNATLNRVFEIAESSVGEDPFGYRAEFLAMVARAKALQGE